MASRRQLRRRQRAWARTSGIQVDDRGYVDKVDENLFRPLSQRSREAFEAAGGAELREQMNAPAKMRALHSSAALVLNVFEHWMGRDARALVGALGLEGALQSIGFEAQFPTGLMGNPPNLDVALELSSEKVVGIESKFGEWMLPKSGSSPPFKDKYFADGAELWSRSGLPACQSLASAMQQGTERFRHLDAAQLLKHALGLATQRPGKFALCYLYYDAPCTAAEVHRQEIDRFAARVGAEIGFRAMSYQSLYTGLLAAERVDSGYLAYLGKRYFD